MKVKNRFFRNIMSLIGVCLLACLPVNAAKASESGPGASASTEQQILLAADEGADQYTGRYISDDGASLTIQEVGSDYSVTLSRSKAVLMEAISEYVDSGKMIISGTDSNGNPIGGMIIWQEDGEGISLVITDSQWDYLSSGEHMDFPTKTEIMESSAPWYKEYHKFRSESGLLEIEVICMNDAELRIVNTGDVTVIDKTVNINPSEIGVDGELIYGDTEFFAYYPDDHHIYYFNLQGLAVGNYWPVEGPAKDTSVSADDFVGDWGDTWSQRCMLTIEEDFGQYVKIEISWSNGMSGNVEWKFDGQFDEETRELKYTGDKILTVYNEDGTVTKEFTYTDGTGIFFIGTDHMLYWEDYKEDAGADCVFEKYTYSEYVIEYSDSQYLTDVDISGLSLQELNYAKNEIYARHGRKFNSPELQNYFNSKSWYSGTVDPANFSTSVLNAYEMANLDVLTNAEYAMNPNGYQLDQ